MRTLFPLLLLLLCPSILVASSFKTERYKPTRTEVYKRVDEIELKVDIYEPEGHTSDSQKPAIIFFFGGGWISGTPAQFYAHCEYFSRRGIVAMAADYRVSSRHKTTPIECVKDAKSAIRWIKANAQRLGVDPTKVIASGGSAGGHIAAATGTISQFNEESDDLSISAVPAAMVLFNPVYDNSIKGYGFNRVKAYWKGISPAHNFSSETPPMITFFGTKDHCLRLEQIEAVEQMAKEAGATQELHLYENQVHGFFNFNRNENKYFDDTTIKADEFLVKLGLIEGSADPKLLPKIVKKKPVVK